MMNGQVVRSAVASLLLAAYYCGAAPAAETLRIGFASADVTPPVNPDRPVWLAGYGPGRRATGVHDPLMARAAVLHDGVKRIAIVGIDSIGLQLPTVRRIRERLPRFDYVLVASSHDHEAPDVIGIWGESFFRNGVDPKYIDLIVNRTVEAIEAADKASFAAVAAYGTAADEKLLGDSRLPRVLDDVLRVVVVRRVDRPESETKPAGLIVQWNCHPEALGSRNTELTADFVAATVSDLERRYGCPVVYVSGALGGLLAPPSIDYRDAAGNAVPRHSFDYADRYGRDVAALAAKAVEQAAPITLAPFTISPKTVYVPVENEVYRFAQSLGMLDRGGYLWTGDFERRGEVPVGEQRKLTGAVETEVAYLRLGELHVAAIPGELYPELVYGNVQQPVEPGADFPNAPVEPHVAKILPGDKIFIAGLANDEIGYLIPKRQWDQQPPFCYGRKQSQYGEINSCSAEAAPIVMEALRRCVEAAKSKRTTDER